MPFAGKDFDADTGLQYSRARWYNASTGSFISRDPIGFDVGDANIYRYAGNSPRNRTDPQKTDWLDSYANWFNGVFGSGYSEAAGSAIYQATVGSGAVSNDTLANASANQLAPVTTAVAIPVGVDLFYGGETIAVLGYANAFAITDTVGSTLLAPAAMAYEGAFSLAVDISTHYPGIWTAASEFLDPA